MKGDIFKKKKKGGVKSNNQKRTNGQKEVQIGTIIMRTIFVNRKEYLV